MAKLSLFVAFAAIVAVASSAKTAKPKPKEVRVACVDNYGQTKPEGSTWREGVNGCLTLTCTNGVAIGIDNCVCTYPDGTTGKNLDVWYSVPTCQTCSCGYGTIACATLLNCVLPPTTSVAPAPTDAYKCEGPDALVLNAGDMFIEGCMNCTCTAAGLNCYGTTECPVPIITGEVAVDGQCYMGWLGVITGVDAATGYTDYVDTGYVFKDGCNTCTCTEGIFVCTYTCTDEPAPTTTETVLPTEEDASIDCDVGDGIVVNGEPYTSECGAACICTNGDMVCEDCPSGTTDVDPTTAVPPTPYVCISTNGDSVDNGKSYMADKCTNCTCINGVFTCFKTCDRDCRTTGGKDVANGGTYKATCQSCKCNDATLTCTNTCAGKSCRVPNSTVTIAAGSSKKIDSCQTCKCTANIVLQCTDKCPATNTGCVCNGRSLRSGKSTKTSKCETCKCNNGKVTCKKTC